MAGKIEVLVQSLHYILKFDKFGMTLFHLLDILYAHLPAKMLLEIHTVGTNQSKIEKVPRGIRGEKSSKDMASSRNLVSTIGALASPEMGDGTRCPEG